jgi:hypothetical protein
VNAIEIQCICKLITRRYGVSFDEQDATNKNGVGIAERGHVVRHDGDRMERLQEVPT